jgi:hypothetical protein
VSNGSAAAKALGDIKKVSVRDPWNSSQTTAIFTELMPPMKWTVEGLGIGPGRPCGLWGKATGGKTLEAIDVALSKASGTKVFGRFAVERGRVLWISYDFPRRPLHTRFRQLANGRGLTPQDLDGMIETCVFPEIYLNTDGAEAKLMARCAGFDLVVLDCYRDSIPGTEENSSEQAVYLKSLARISDAQGTGFLYLHHLKKGQESEESTIDSGRGSGAIAAASGSIWALEGTGNKPRLMRNIRPHDACTDFAAPFYIELLLGGTGGPFPCDEPPIRLEARTETEMAGDAFFAQVERNKAGARDQVKLLVSLLRSHPNCTVNELRKLCKATPLANHEVRRLAIEEAVEDGLVVRSEQTGKGGKRVVHNLGQVMP